MTLDLRKIPQSGVISHRGLSGLFGHLRIGNSEVFVFSLPCLVSVTLDLRKILQSGDMSHRGLSVLFGHFRTGNLEVLFYFVFG